MVNDASNYVNFVFVKIFNFLFGISSQIYKILNFEGLRDILLKNVDSPFEGIILLVHESLSIFYVKIDMYMWQMLECS